ncbi:uncharacterized protein METZ01_LOCUS431190, partial [marine metagenome]
MLMRNRRQVDKLPRSMWLPLIVAVIGSLFAMPGDTGAAEPPAPLAGAVATANDVEATINRYCVSCHNDRIVNGRDAAPSTMVSQLGIAGVAFDVLDTSHVAGDAATWERVVRKLQSRTMPPVGRPRPDDATYDAVALWIES